MCYFCLKQCFSTRVPRVAASGFAETDQICPGRNSQPQFHLVVGILTLGSLRRAPWATQTFAEGSAATKRLENTDLKFASTKSDNVVSKRKNKGYFSCKRLCRYWGTWSMEKDPSCSCLVRRHPLQPLLIYGNSPLFVKYLSSFYWLVTCRAHESYWNKKCSTSWKPLVFWSRESRHLV